MQKEGNISWGESRTHSWTVWVTRWGAWRWQVSGPRGWMASGGVANEQAALEAVWRTLVERGDPMAF